MKIRSIGPRSPGRARAPRWLAAALLVGLLAASCSDEAGLVVNSTAPAAATTAPAPATTIAAPATTLGATVTTVVATTATSAATTTTVATSNGPAAPLLEAEDLSPVAAQDVYLTVQDMSPWGAENWSGGAQLFVGTEVGGSVDLILDIPDAGLYETNIFATRAPDFGVVRVRFSNGVVLPDLVDLYSPTVEPTLLIQLEKVLLEAGPQVMTIEVVDKNPSSAGFNFGVDLIQMFPVAP